MDSNPVQTLLLHNISYSVNYMLHCYIKLTSWSPNKRHAKFKYGLIGFIRLSLFSFSFAIYVTKGNCACTHIHDLETRMERGKDRSERIAFGNFALMRVQGWRASNTMKWSSAIILQWLAWLHAPTSHNFSKLDASIVF